jgi:hypothetical protein
MKIELEKFGITLNSRQLGKEVLLAFNSILSEVKVDELIEIDFDGVNTFTTSWGDEFLTPLQTKFQERLILKNVDNPSVKATIEILEQTNGTKFRLKN